MTEVECTKLFRAMDPDGSGTITYQVNMNRMNHMNRLTGQCTIAYQEFAKELGDTIVSIT